jgi:zinc transport system substrate-binding protein
MKKLSTIGIALLLLVACQPRQANQQADGKPVVTVSILPQKFFIEKIAGDYFNVNVLVPPGADPHDYEPTPRQMSQLARSEVYFYVGHMDFELSWLEKMASSAPKVSMVSNSNGIELLDGEGRHDGEHQHHQHAVDPHIWTSPWNVKIISRGIFEALSARHPEQKALFEPNLNRIISEIDSLDKYLRQKIDGAVRNTFMIYHPALAYFAADYHLEQYTVELEGKSPSPAQMKRIIDFARAENIRTIFIQSQFETARAEAIAREIEAKVEAIDPLAYNWLEEMYSLGDKLQKALNE